MFTPIPAIDIRGGRCVRLVQGDFAREKRYADDPVEMARHWANQGARRLHVVDAAGYLGIRPWTLRHWISDRKIDVVKYGNGIVRIRRSVGIIDDAERRFAADQKKERGAHVFGLRELAGNGIPHAELFQRRLAVFSGGNGRGIGHRQPSIAE